MATQRRLLKLRGDFMRDAKTRQLIALTAAAALALATASAEPATPREQLQALEIAQAALAATGGDEAAWQKLEQAYDRLAAEQPRNAAILAARGDLRWERGAHTGAVEDWEAARQLEPGRTNALVGLAGAAVAAGDPVKAAALHREAVTTAPASALAHFALANVLFLFRHQLHDATHPDEASLLREALGHFAEAARLAPANLEYARAYAETFYSLPQPDWEAARRAWEKVRDLSPAKDFALIHLARVNLSMRHLDASRECLNQVQNPAFQRIKANLEKQLAASEAPPASLR